MKQIIILAAALAAGQLAWACESCETHAVATEAIKADSMTVVRDAETGQLRAPTAAEASALQRKPLTASKVTRAATAAPQVKAYAGGAHSAKLPQRLASFSVVNRQPDGTLHEQCVDGEEAAAKAIQPRPVTAPSPVKELQ